MASGGDKIIIAYNGVGKDEGETKLHMASGGDEVTRVVDPEVLLG